MSSALHVVRLDEVEPQPWRNGGGVTRELLAWPPGSGADWQLRVSVAEIERDGPFSAYPGVHRCFAVLEGAGVMLGWAGGNRRLTQDTEPLACDGAAAPDCRLIDGPTRDLNLMARASAGQIRMQRAVAGVEAPCAARWHGVYTASPAVLQPQAGEALTLPAHSLAWGDEPGARWALGSDGGLPLRAWWMLCEPDR